MKCNGIQFLRPDPLLAKGITFQRHDPGWRLYHLPLQSRLTKGHSRQSPWLFSQYLCLSEKTRFKSLFGVKCTRNFPTGSLVLALSLIIGQEPTLADEGMWLFNQPPKELLQAKYGFEVTDDWLEHLQRASVRFNSGGSGSFVSADGLVLTNHHVAAEAVQKLSSEDRDLLAEGYYARSRDSELPCVDLELNVLVSIRDVTDRINAAVSADLDAEAAFLARRAAIAAVEKESFEGTGLRSDVITLYQGGAYHLYRFKRYTDVRLVFAPEQQIAFFGGDPDNFEYPRYALDFTFFRAYENDKPAKIDNFLRWNSRGPTDGELVFVTGHPGRTSRLLTVAELEYDRDTLQPDVISWLNRIEVLLSAYSSRSAENTRRAKDLLFVIQNSRKAYNGMHAGLLDPEFFAQKRQQETTLRQAVASNPAYQPTADAWDRIANAQEDIKSVRTQYNFFEGGRAFFGDLFPIARTLLRAAIEIPKNNGDRLREYTDSGLESLKFQLFSEKPIYSDLEILTLTDSLIYLADTLGSDDSMVKAILAGRAPGQAATDLVTNTRVGDVDFRKQLFDGGIEAVNLANDPMIELARLVDDGAREARKVIDAAIETKRAAHADIADVRFAIQGSSIYPDATFTLRLAFGTIAGYSEGGQSRNHETYFQGLYERADSQDHVPPFHLPTRWLEVKDSLNLQVPVNFVSKVDVIGGNSGSPVVNREGELVGLIFDGNIYTLPWRYGYDDKIARAISVHTGGIMEALESVYRAEKLINELTQPTISAIDDDDDGMGDIWECHFGAKALAPEEDEDGDGVINRDEALAGTNPLDATSAFHPVVAGEGFDPGSGNRSLVIRWNTVIGKQYELRSSSDLANWVAVGDLWPGTGQVAEMVIDLTGRSPLNDFYQVAVLDRDRDRDGLSAYEEALLGFSDLNVNSAGAPSGNDLEAARKLLTGLSPTGEIISICPDTGTSENHGPG